MTTPRNFAKNAGWGRADHTKGPLELFPLPLNTHRRTSTLNRHMKQPKPTEASLFDLLPIVILVDVEIWVSGLKHRDAFKAVVSRINSMYNPVLFVIPPELWTPYHNFRVVRWYNEGFYE